MSSDNTLYAFSIDTPAFSREYLDEEIPDFRAVIRQTIPISVVQNGENVHFQIGGQSVSDSSFFRAAIQASLATGAKFVCYDAVAVHRTALRFVGESQELLDVVWQLTDHHALWDVGLFEQRLVWSVEGRTIDFPSLDELQERYGVEGLPELFLAQFNRLVSELPILRNDVVGNMIFADPPPESPYIDSPERILARRFHFKERLHLFIHLIRGWEQYGPGSIGLDIQGAIAASYLSKHVHQFANCRTRFLGIRDDLLRRNRREINLRECYSDDSTIVHGDGTPKYTEQAHKIIRELWDSSTESETDGSERGNHLDLTIISVYQSRSYPLDSVGRASLNPNHWAETIPPTGHFEIGPTFIPVAAW